MEKRDLDEMERISRKEEYLTVRCRPNWMYGFDGRQIMIASSENGVLFVPIEDAERLLQEFSGVAAGRADICRKLRWMKRCGSQRKKESATESCWK